MLQNINLTQREIKVGVLAASTGVVAGFGLGYGAAKKRLALKYKQFAEDEISEMARHYREARIFPGQDKPEPEELLQRAPRTADELGAMMEETAAKIVAKQRYSDVEAEAIEAAAVKEEVDEVSEPQSGLEAVIEQNIFERAAQEEMESAEWDQEAEEARRTVERPFIISTEEYGENESDFAQSTLTWFSGDDVLCDERDKIIDNRDELIGDENLSKVGHGSHDPNTVHIRNVALQVEYEIIRSPGHYAQEVHGFTPDDTLQHSVPMRRRRSRFDDE